eukprot:TRINITY_DN11955_c0_g1_i1.p1 TRINITY_DN11955_c0_g1~~TRINITY_DN11955_c0_g1_i1.p1  ORF type:complete len:267 (-),score=39.75 TRINITY_DN11955_c0_g1_i1:165-965(-)
MSGLDLKGPGAEQCKGVERHMSPEDTGVLRTPSTVDSEQGAAVVSGQSTAPDSESSEACSPSLRAAYERVPDPSKMRMAESRATLELRLPQLTIEDVYDLITDNDIFLRYHDEVQGFRPTKTSPWLPSSAGSQVRAAKVLITMPKDFPKAVQKLINIPEVAEASMAWRVVKVDDGLDVVMQNYNTEVPLGDRFIVEELCRFRSHPEGGVTLSKKVGLVWVRPFTWSLKWLQKVVEHQVTQKSQLWDPAFTKFVGGLSAPGVRTPVQ